MFRSLIAEALRVYSLFEQLPVLDCTIACLDKLPLTFVYRTDIGSVPCQLPAQGALHEAVEEMLQLPLGLALPGAQGFGIVKHGRLVMLIEIPSQQFFRLIGTACQFVTSLDGFGAREWKAP